MKAILLYILFFLGIPNIVGQIFAIPLGIIAVRALRVIFPRMSTSNPFLGILAGLTFGIGCGAAGLLLVLLFGRLPDGTFPIISSVWSLFYYYSRGQPKDEAWGGVAGIFAVWIGYWSRHVT